MMDYKSMTTPMMMNLKKLSGVAANSDLVSTLGQFMCEPR
jgi:hypothetical protein